MGFVTPSELKYVAISPDIGRHRLFRAEIPVRARLEVLHPVKESRGMRSVGR